MDGSNANTVVSGEKIAADDELLLVFQEESAELCMLALAQLELLKTQPELSKIDELLRYLHTLKGCAQLVGYRGLVNLTHVLEAKADTLREQPQVHLIDSIIESVEFIQMAVSQIHSRNAPSPPQYLLSVDIQDALSDEDEEAVQDAPVLAQQSITWEQSGFRVSMELMERYSGSIRKLIKLYSDNVWQMDVQNHNLVELFNAANTLEAAMMDELTKSKIPEEAVANLQQALQTHIWRVKALINGLSRSVSITSDTNDKQGLEIKYLENNIISARLIDFKQYIPRLSHLVAVISKKLNKQVALKCQKTEAEVDKRLLEKLMPAFEHLIRNAIDHGIESQSQRAKTDKPDIGTIEISLKRESNHLIFEFSDDGKGIDVDAIRQKNKLTADMVLNDESILNILKQPGFSTKHTPTEISGRGVGIEAVDHLVQSLGGQLQLNTKVVSGTQYIISIPIAQSQHTGLMFVANDIKYFFPISHVKGMTRVSNNACLPKMVSYGQRNYFIKSFSTCMNQKGIKNNKPFLPCVIVELNGDACAFAVDKVIGVREFIIQKAHVALPNIELYQGLSILFDGEIVYALDTASFLQKCIKGGALADRHADLAPVADFKDLTIMVIDDSPTVHEHLLEYLPQKFKNVYSMSDPLHALEFLDTHSVDIILTDIEMPSIDGFAFVRQLKNLSMNQSIPVLMMTTRREADDLARAKAAGAQQIIYKPFEETQLQMLIVECLHAAN